MWDFLLAIFQTTGIVGLACILEAVGIVVVVRMYQKKDARVEILQHELLKMSEKRLEDTIEEREKYEELAQGLDKTIDLLIKSFRRRNGSNGSEH